MNTILLHCK